MLSFFIGMSWHTLLLGYLLPPPLRSLCSLCSSPYKEGTILLVYFGILSAMKLIKEHCPVFSPLLGGVPAGEGSIQRGTSSDSEASGVEVKSAQQVTVQTSMMPLPYKCRGASRDAPLCCVIPFQGSVASLISPDRSSRGHLRGFALCACPVRQYPYRAKRHVLRVR